MRTNIQLGDRVRDKISGFEGICIAKTEWLNGCVRITIQPEKLQEKGTPIEGQTFDCEQVAIVLAGAHKQDPQPTGGPHPEPTRSEI